MAVPLNLVGRRRLMIGLAQGLVLYGLALATTERRWPATDPFVFAPLFLAALYVPIVAVLGLERLQPRHLGGWLAIVAVALVGLALHDVSRRVGAPEGPPGFIWGTANRPSFELMIFAAAALFIAHSLVMAAAAEGTAIARYPVYFDAAWKQGVQFVLGWTFVGLFWLILQLGAVMFSMLHLEFFQETIAKPWFSWPATFLSLATAIHLTDVAPGIIAGLRKLALTLMSWLLPLLLLIVVGFLGALAATSITLLWNTRHGAQVVLSATGTLVFLANAAYQQGPPRPGEDGHLPPPILAWSGMAVGPVALLLVALAGYATLLRVSQYGWTTNRVILSAIDGIAAVYAIGYTLAGPWSSTPRRRWETTNLISACLTIAVILALMSPVADPSHIAVASQIARLETGRIAVEKFDFAAVRFDGQRYGQDALRRLAHGPDPFIGERAVAALATTNRFEAAQRRPPPSAGDIVANMVVFPAGHAVPSGLAVLEFPKNGVVTKPGCFTTPGRVCDVVVIGNSSADADMAVIFDPERAGFGVIAKAGPDGRWSAAATLPVGCKTVREALLGGTYSLVQPAIPDFAIGHQRLSPNRTDGFTCDD
jgi:hypothetical protein